MSGTPRCCNTLRSTFLGNLDPVIRLFEGIFLTASANLIRNREFHVDYLSHAQPPGVLLFRISCPGTPDKSRDSILFPVASLGRHLARCLPQLWQAMDSRPVCMHHK